MIWCCVLQIFRCVKIKHSPSILNKRNISRTRRTDYFLTRTTIFSCLCYYFYVLFKDDLESSKWANSIHFDKNVIKNWERSNKEVIAFRITIRMQLRNGLYSLEFCPVLHGLTLNILLSIFYTHLQLFQNIDRIARSYG